MKEIHESIERALNFDKKTIGEFITIFEDFRPETFALKKSILAGFRAKSDKNASIIGITGAPGSGKSSLIGRTAPLLVEINTSISAAVIAIDPSSKITGGSLLGDRIRARFSPGEKRLFFRSQASHNSPGGTGRNTFQVTRLLSLIFDYILIETVGTGQEDSEITRLADKTFLILQPGSGDRIQFLKAGIMEIPDCIVLNKMDHEDFEDSYANLSAAVQMFSRQPSVYRTNSITGEGLEKIAGEILNTKKEKNAFETELHYFTKWIFAEYGIRGMSLLRNVAMPEEILKDKLYYEDAQTAVSEIIENTYRKKS